MTGSSTSRGLSRRSFLGTGLKAGLVALAAPHLARRALAGAEAPEVSRCWYAMGTFLEIRIADLPEDEAYHAIRRVRARVEELESFLTLFREESPLVRFNRSVPGTPVDVPADLLEGMEIAQRAMRDYPAQFTCFAGPQVANLGLVELPRPQLDPATLARRLHTEVSGSSLEVHQEYAVRTHPLATVDLGAVGKGMAMDEAVTMLRLSGSRSALVNFGGSLAAVGPPLHDERGWLVGLAHPRRQGDLWATFRLREGHLATSGDYEHGGYASQFPGGKTHHLIDPASMLPGRGTASATVWHVSGVEADILSTVTFLAGSGRGITTPSLVLQETPEGLLEERGGAFAAAGTAVTEYHRIG